MSRKIDIYVSAISRKNGGNSSVLDLAKTLILLKYDIKIYTRIGLFDRFIYKVKDFKDFRYVFINPYKTIRRVNIIQRFFNFLVKPDNTRVPDIIIDAELLYSINSVKGSESAIKILNHAGSIEAFQEFLRGTQVDYTFLIQSYNGFLFQSKMQMVELKNIIKPTQKLYHLYPSISEDQLQKYKSAPTPFKSEEFNVVQVGSIIKRKNQLSTLKIAESLIGIEKIRFHIVGPIIDNNYFAELKDYCRQNKLTNVKFWDYREDYPRFLKHSDLVIQVSKSEGLSRIIREAYYYNKPVYSFNIKGATEVINSGIGAIFEFEDHQSFAEGIKKLMDNHALSERYRKEIQYFFNTTFAYKNYRKSVNDLFQEI